MISFKETLYLAETMKGVSKALALMATKPELKNISKNLLSLSKRAAENDKNAAKQVNREINKLLPKVHKKHQKVLGRLSQLAGTYESVHEGVGVDCRTKGYKEAAKRAEARKVKKESSKKSEIDEIISRTNKALQGTIETMVASGSDSTGNIDGKDMPLGKVKKRKGFKEGLAEDYYTVQYYNAKGKAEDGKNKTFKQNSKAQAYAKKGNATDKVGGMYKIFMVKGSMK